MAFVEVIPQQWPFEYELPLVLKICEMLANLVYICNPCPIRNFKDAEVSTANDVVERPQATLLFEFTAEHRRHPRIRLSMLFSINDNGELVSDYAGRNVGVIEK